MSWQEERAADGPITNLVIATRVPSKWVIYDRETGHQWEWRDGRWKAPSDDERLWIAG